MNFNARKCNDGISRDRARAHPLWTIEEDDMRLVEVEHVVALVAERGLETVLADLVDHIEADFRRWDEFDKSPRFASHSPGGVIELMPAADARRSEEHTSELQSLMRISYAVFCLKKK